jgi:hypothetical protein
MILKKMLRNIASCIAIFFNLAAKLTYFLQINNKIGGKIPIYHQCGIWNAIG